MALRIISSAQITLNNVFDSFNVIVSNENFSIACDDTGIPLSGEIGQNGKAISTISVYRANTKLTPVSSNPSANQFSISIANQINCQGAKKDNDKIYINTLSNGVTGKIVVNINIEGNNTVTKEITFSKTLNSLSDLIDGKFVFGLSNWTNAQNGTGDIGSNVKIIDSNLSTYTGKLLEITNEKWFYNKKTIDVEDNKIYEFKIRFKQSIDNTTGGKHSYFGYTPYNSAGNAFGTNGANNMYLIGGEELSTTSWKEATFYLSKTALPELINDGKVIRPAVRAFPTGTVKFRPMFIVNFSGGNGVALVDYCLVQDVSDKFNIKELDYKTTVLESKNGEINAAVNKIRTFAQLSNNPISLAAKVNYAAYDSPNDGEVYVHGLNSQKKAADIDGSCLWQDNQITLPRQMFNPNGLVPEQTAIFMVRSTADNKWYSVWKDGATWKKVAADVTTNNTISTFTPSDTTDIFIGYYVTRKSNNQNGETPIDVAQIFTGALDYRQASSMSFASSISQMKIIEDEVSLKSSKDEMLMGVNKWKRTKYRKTLANSSTYPTFNDIANLTPIAQDEVRDSTNLVAGMTGDDHFILHFFTNVFVKSAKNISITGNGVDDTATFFVNGVEAGRINTSETVTMSLKAGWNTLEILFYEHEGGESMNINTNISSLVDNMAYAIGGQSSAITLTPNQIDIMSKNINLTGKVTIDSLASGMRDMFSTENGKTVIDGGHIKTGSINADNISTGTLNTDRLNIGGVINKINADGSHTISGNKVTIDGQGISSVFSTKTELTQKFDNLQIGGRNLIRKTNTEQSNISWSMQAGGYTVSRNGIVTRLTRNNIAHSGWSVIQFNDITQNLSLLKPNTDYMLSFDVQSNYSGTLRATLLRGDGVDGLTNSKGQSITANIWNHVILKLTTIADLSKISNQIIYITGMNNSTDAYYEFKNIKFEEGNAATNWSPAPEDIDAAVKQAQKTANDANQMFTDMASDSKLTPAEKKNTKTEWQNINNEYSRIRQQAINVNISTTAYDNSYNTLNTYLTNLLSNMNTTSAIDSNYKNNFTNYYNARQDLLKTVSDKLNNKIDNIKVGGNNLWRYSDPSVCTNPSDRYTVGRVAHITICDSDITHFFNKKSFITKINNGETNGYIELKDPYINIPMDNTKEYTFSGVFYLYSGVKQVRLTEWNGSSQVQNVCAVSRGSDGTTLVNATFKPKVPSGNPSRFTIYFDTNGTSDGGDNYRVQFGCLSMSLGNKSTTWNPNPLDLKEFSDKALSTAEQSKNYRLIYARGTGNDYAANSVVKIENNIVSNGQGRGLRVIAIDKISLKVLSTNDYDTYGGGDAINNFANKINELNNQDRIIVVTSQDASYPLNETVKAALQKIGATLYDRGGGTYREAYALIGKSKLGKGNGLEMFIPRTANDHRYAEVSVKVSEDGTLLGVGNGDAYSQLDTVSSTVSSTVQRVNAVEQNYGGISSRVSTLETKEILNRKVSSFRYIRDWLNGSTVNNGNHWVEIQVIAGGTNVAQGKAVTASGNISNGDRITNGDTNSSNYAEIPNNGSWNWVQIDLGSVRNDIDAIKIWHYYQDARAYNTKLQVSRDGTTWFELYNSDINGMYKETSNGRCYVLNEAYTEKRLSEAESKITDTAITNTIKNSNTFYTKGDIDAKGYQNSSQVQQTVDALQLKFQQSGGYNLLHNGCGKNGTAFWSDNGGGIRVGTTGDGSSMGKCNYFDSQFPSGITGEWIKLKPNTNYIYSAKLWTTNNITGTPVTPLHFWCNSTQDGGGQSALTVIDYKTNCSINAWNDVYVHFKTVSSGNIWFKPFIYHNGASGNFSVTELMLQEGSIKAPYSPHPSEVYDGITMIDKNGVTVTASNVNTKTNMSASGFKITKINNGEDIFRVDQQGLFLKGRLQIESVVDGIKKDQLENNLKNDINNAVSNSSNALGQINNLQIGGRNFAQKTSNDYSNSYSGFNGNDNMCPTVATVITKGLKVGDQITVRLIYNYSNIVAVSGRTPACWLQGAGNVTEWNEGGFPSKKYYPTGTGEIEMLYTYTLTAAHLRNNSWSVNIRHDGFQSGTVKWKEFKVEKGNKATDWSPAPEDVSNRIEKTEQSISSLQDGIKLKVSQTDIDRSISNIKIGGRNLLLNTALTNDSSYWSFDAGIGRSSDVDNALGSVNHSISYDISGKTGDCWYAANPSLVPCISGEKVSAQVMVIMFDDNRLDTGYNVCGLEIQYFNSSGQRIKTDTSDFINSNSPKNKWFKVVCENKTVPDGAVKMNARVWARRNAKLWIGNLKLEKSTKCSDWTPAPEDVDQSILDVYDNTSQLINEVTSNYESAINIMKDSIESTVSETYTTKDDFSTTVESISSKIDQQSDSITASITTATKQLSEDLQDYKDEVTSYMRFDEQGLELGKSNNKFKTRLSNEKLSFIEEDQEVAYISNNKMNITDAEIKHQMILGNFAFVPRSNGNMSLKWIRK